MIDFKRTHTLNSVFNSNNIATVISQIINGIMAIILGKLIALNISPEIFGTYNLEFGIVSFALSLFISPVIQFYKNKVPEFSQYNNTKSLFIAYAIISGILCSIISILILNFSQKIFNYWIILIVVAYVFSYIIFTYKSEFLNVTGGLVLLAKLNILKPLINVLAITVGIYFISKTSEILWVSMILSFTFPLVFFKNKKLSLLSFKLPDKNKQKIFYDELSIYAFPLILMSVTSWVNSFADRYIINHYYSTVEVGLYNAGYGLGAKVFLFLSSISLVLITPKIYNLSKDKLGEQTSNKIINKYLLYFMIIGSIIVLIIFFAKDIIGQILLSETYNKSFKIIPWIATGYLFLMLMYIINVKFYVFSKTKWLLYINIFSAIINIFLNFILLPQYGIIGSAISATISFVSGFIFCFILMHKKIFK